MFRLLKVNRSSLYYQKDTKNIKHQEDEKLVYLIKTIFKRSRNNYGTRKIKIGLMKSGYQISRRRIGLIMKENGLGSIYTVKYYKLHKTSYNNDKIDNVLNRKFNQKKKMNVIISDLTYINVTGKWNYICLILDLFNREIVGYSAGVNKDAKLVKEAIYSISYDLSKIELFHTDRGNEFKNKKLIKY